VVLLAAGLATASPARGQSEGFPGPISVLDLIQHEAGESPAIVPFAHLSDDDMSFQVVDLNAQPEEQQPAAGDQQAPERPIGRAPEDTRLNFLRTATVLLQPGQAQFDYGGRYTWRDFGIPLLLVQRNRQIYSPFALRYGLTPRAQLFANVPVGFAIGEDPEPNRFSSLFGVGDSSAGVNFLVRDGYCDQCDIVGTIGFTAPLGHHPLEDIRQPLRNLPTPISGSGCWGVNANLTFIKAYDPAVVFASVGYQHLFARSFGDGPAGPNGAYVTPGEQFSYSLGVGFAINDRLTLSTAFFGTFETVTIVDQFTTPPGIFTRTTFNQEPFQVRLALTATVSPWQIVEPFVAFGISPDAPNADFGITCTRTF
jgi:hypothetical protein